jgi:hypothetical protein
VPQEVRAGACEDDVVDIEEKAKETVMPKRGGGGELGLLKTYSKLGHN